jgi:cell division transport system permease protein
VSRALRYALEEALVSLWRGRQSGLLSTATIALALFVLGAFLLVSTNLDRLGLEWSRTAGISVYLADEVTPGERAAIEHLLAPSRLVAGYDYVSKAGALFRFKETFRDLSATVDGVGDNPLPASYDVRLQNVEGSHQAIDGLVTRLRQTAGVADVQYDREWLDRLAAIVDAIRVIGLLLGTALTVAAALTVANVVRLALFVRREEIEIMQLVGAPPVYVRGPFVVEGLLQGCLGALGALAALAVGFLALRASYLAPLSAALHLSPVRFLPWELCVVLLAGGMLVGCLGGLVAAWSGRIVNS